MKLVVRWYCLTGGFWLSVVAVAVQKPQIIEPGKVLVEAFSIVTFFVTYGAQTKETDDFMSSVVQTVVLFSKQGKCLS